MIDRLKIELEKPDADEDFVHSGVFDPWEIFPALYGSYCSSFDECAIGVLEGLAADPMRWDRDDLGAQMFREMLCAAGLCDYGTSPRVCFPTPEFKAVLPTFIARWKTYYLRVWTDHTQEAGEWT